MKAMSKYRDVVDFVLKNYREVYEALLYIDIEEYEQVLGKEKMDELIKVAIDRFQSYDHLALSDISMCLYMELEYKVGTGKNIPSAETILENALERVYE